MKPIIFQEQMVRAILDGLKTQTRRVKRRTIEPGNILYVREAVYLGTDDDPDTPFRDYDGRPRKVYHRATHGPVKGHRCTPAIHMPRWATRIRLKVEDVKMQELHEIGADDAHAEGIVMKQTLSGLHYFHPTDYGRRTQDPILAFRWLWDSINKERGFGWDVNPKV